MISGAAPMTPGAIVPQSQFVIARKLPTYSDGTDAPLKHAPRRKSSTGEKAADPSQRKAKVPANWRNKIFVVAGSKKKVKVVEDALPDFASWRKNHSRKDRPKVTGVRPGPGVEVHQMPFRAEARTPHQHSKDEAMTPMPAPGGPGDFTPAPQGETPLMPHGETPRMAGVETPGYGAETPMPGDETPRAPHMAYDGVVWSKGEATPMMGMGDATPPVMPICPTRADLMHKRKDMEGTPQVPKGFETPIPEYMPGIETPLMPPPIRAHQLHTFSGAPATPPRGGAAAATDLTPRNVQDPSLKPGMVAL